jgi:hypothetical protein
LATLGDPYLATQPFGTLGYRSTVVAAVQGELYRRSGVEWLVGVVASFPERVAVPAPEQAAYTEETSEE